MIYDLGNKQKGVKELLAHLSSPAWAHRAIGNLVPTSITKLLTLFVTILVIDPHLVYPDGFQFSKVI